MQVYKLGHIFYYIVLLGLLREVLTRGFFGRTIHRFLPSSFARRVPKRLISLRKLVLSSPFLYTLAPILIVRGTSMIVLPSSTKNGLSLNALRSFWQTICNEASFVQEGRKIRNSSPCSPCLRVATSCGCFSLSSLVTISSSSFSLPWYSTALNTIPVWTSKSFMRSCP